MINPKDYHILLAEDDDWLRGTFTILLERQGFLCTTVQDGKELYAEASKGNFRLNPNLVVVSDTDMPYLDGDEACKKLLDEFPEYRKKIIVGMSDDASYEKLWNDLIINNTFIYKGQDIAISDSKRNLAHRVINNINFILGNPEFHLNPDGSFKYKV